MTLLPTKAHEIVAVDLFPYDVPPYCAHPECTRDMVDTHEICRRSHMAGVKWWVNIGGVTVGNRVGLCRDHHRDVTGDVGGHRAWIRWVEPEQQFLWLVKTPEADVEWEALGELEPHPPVHSHEDSEGATRPDEVGGLRRDSAQATQPPDSPGVSSSERSCRRCNGTGKDPTGETMVPPKREPKRRRKRVPILVPDDAEDGAEILMTLVEAVAEKVGRPADTPAYFVLVDALQFVLTANVEVGEAA